MRIESNHQQSHNSTQYTPSSKKRREKKEKNKSPDYFDDLDLSKEAKLLNQLLKSDENKFQPLPFYFTNAPARNIKQACTISHQIQKKAETFDIALNYTMIYDMVVSHAMQQHNGNICWTYGKPTTDVMTSCLTEEEKELFEKMYYACEQKQVSTNVINKAAVAYIELKQKSSGYPLPFTAKECAHSIVSIFKKNTELLKRGLAQDLSNIIQQFVGSKIIK